MEAWSKLGSETQENPGGVRQGEKREKNISSIDESGLLMEVSEKPTQMVFIEDDHIVDEFSLT